MNCTKSTTPSDQTKGHIEEYATARHVSPCPNFDEVTLEEALSGVAEGASRIRQMIFALYWHGHWKAAGYKSFAEFEEKVLRNYCGKSTTYRLIAVAAIDLELDLEIGTVPITVAGILSRAQLSEEDLKKVWGISTKGLPSGKMPSAKVVSRSLELFQQLQTVYDYLTNTEKFQVFLNEIGTNLLPRLSPSLKLLQRVVNAKQ